MALCLPPGCHAVITHTNVFAGMRIDVMGVTEVSGTDTDETFAAVDLTSPSTGARVSSALLLDGLSAETANLSFSLDFDANGMTGYGYMGRLSPGSIAAEMFYHADVETRLDYDWSFDYSEPNPFGLGRIYVKVDGTTISDLGNAGFVGYHEGRNTFSLSAGGDYVFQVVFSPNASGTNWESLEGTLEGSISFHFVPEPMTAILLGAGMLGLRRRRRVAGGLSQVSTEGRN
jgi:hypothetical protein